jgi:ABC-type dipeptide/oligopeptide/nickel transport system permease subunit
MSAKTIQVDDVKIERTHPALSFLGRMLKSGSAKLGAVIFVCVVLFCVVGPFLIPYGVNDIDITLISSGPCEGHPFGTDSMGRDMMARLMYGGRYSLALGLITSLFQACISMVIGSIAGYFGGKVEMFIMRLLDVWSALPSMLLCILVSAVLGPGFFTTVLALTVGGIPGGVRMLRGQILSERGKEYVEAAESINCSKISIMFKHLLPNCVQPTIVSTTMGVGNTMIAAASLSYIGLGIQPPAAEWGAMLAEGRGYIRTKPHLIAVPGIIIALTVLSINLLGDGLRSALDPKLRD